MEWWCAGIPAGRCDGWCAAEGRLDVGVAWAARSARVAAEEGAALAGALLLAVGWAEDALADDAVATDEDGGTQAAAAAEVLAADEVAPDDDA